MTDDQRITSIKEILKRLHNPETGFEAKREELRRQYKNNDDYYREMENVVRRVAKTHGATDTSTGSEMLFMWTGQDVCKNRFSVTCGQKAKAFCYVNSLLPPDEQLELRIMMSTAMDHLVDGGHGHTLPCVKMSDGKWYAIEPNPHIIKNRPKHPQYPDIPFILDNISVGKEIHHILDGIEDKPYKVMKMMPWEEYEREMSDFTKFLAASVERDETSQFLIASIEKILADMNIHNGRRHSVYDFCCEMSNTKSPIRVVTFRSDNPRAQDDYMRPIELGSKENMDLYYFMPTHHYLMLHKLQDLGNNRVLDMDSGKQYNILSRQTPAEYIREYESLVNTKSQERAM